MADAFGRRRLFLIGLAVFSAASLFAGLAPSPGTLIAARAVQGVGAALLTPPTLAIVNHTFQDSPAAALRSASGAPWPRSPSRSARSPEA